ncbi:poly-gamma-glutamate biosynthesis protein PgsC/CapC [Okeania sp.]|uniref:poly-gamma-glutamate biosynthesis protein PgsC/CapC n=1 Tax=Okeania sp. TaxID=3100323 RepID=UPI002B4AFDFA|nr:poly-gamma-glutamate biosynthesis protein PgsC/CapC [Okeania sp.]MEB3342320.1 poly-gamma-glutamate biosynthesis protein PgsC/CapC [Okeania sp.]
MFEFLNTSEITRLALLIGAFAAIYYKDNEGIVPGGVIVPGLLVVTIILSPIWGISLIGLAFILFSLYQRYFSHLKSLQPRTPMYILAIMSLCLVYPLAILYDNLGWVQFSEEGMTGSLIPAIIAFSWTKQKQLRVVQGVGITTLFTGGIVATIYWLGWYWLDIDFNIVHPAYAETLDIEFSYPLLQFGLVLVLSYLIYQRSSVRSGGYIVLPAAAALLMEPLSAVTFLLGCLLVGSLSWLICRYSLTIGLNRYGLVLFMSVVYVWGVELLLLQYNPTLVPFRGLNLLVVIAMITLVNDSLLYWKKGGLKYISLVALVAITLNILATYIKQLQVFI